MSSYDDLEEIIGNLRERLSELKATSEMQEKAQSLFDDVAKKMDEVLTAKEQLEETIRQTISQYDSFSSEIRKALEKQSSDVEKQVGVISERVDTTNATLQGSLNDLKDFLESAKDTINDAIERCRSDIQHIEEDLASNREDHVLLSKRIDEVDQALKAEQLRLSDYKKSMDKKWVVAIIIGAAGIIAGIIGIVL